ncbi:alcohol dehydrogenase [Brachybacterium sp. AG952]|uniref:alcohol dehydrogenase catalytic domain-containing protein n=1 Tax=Brachybacterium TaxID=43668 RepID=UPI00026C6BE9|nr:MULTISPECIES: alcohol dehydrogenase catalytic domain-containing protein [Brachybacterium]TDP80201.1 alcohol dehydrogenase [Brachybacterium sp. AG952]
MRAVVIEQFGLRPEVRDLPAPSAPPGGVVLDVEATGLCRSDHHAFAGHDDSVTLPRVPGHEMVGRVAALGEGVRAVRVGDRVTTPFVEGCGRCRWCRQGAAQICPDQTQPGFTHDGSWAEQVVIRAADHNLVPVGEELPAEAVVTLGCRFATAYRALTARAGLRAGESVAVIGCGGVGLSAIMIAASLGARPIAVDIDPGALALAREHGAAVAVDSRGLDPAATAAAIVEAAGERPTASVEALGREATTDAALLALAPLGRHVQIGLYAEPPRLAIPRVISQELAVLGSHGMAAADYPGLLALVREGSLRPQDLVTRTLDLEQACDALVELGERTPAGVGIIRP